MLKNQISPSILSANFLNLSLQLDLLKTEKIKNLHIDVMDGHFVKNLTFGIPIIKAIKTQFPNFILETHLMVKEPEKFLDMFMPFSDVIIFHYEATSFQENIIKKLKSFNKKIGISIKPKTSSDEIYPFLNFIDMILIMTVEPGFAGQTYIKEMNEKIYNLKNYISSKNLNLDISVDGGIDEKTIFLAKENGANSFVIGSKLFNNDLKIMQKNIKNFKNILDME